MEVFTLFPKLPKEIQCKIWKFHCSTGRVVIITDRGRRARFPREVSFKKHSYDFKLLSAFKSGTPCGTLSDQLSQPIVHMLMVRVTTERSHYK
jgi:hypothetical protein